MSATSNSQPAPTQTSEDLLPATPIPQANSGEALRAVLGQDAVPFFASFALNTPIGRKLLDKCDEAEDARLKGAVNLILRVEHVYAKPVQIIDKNTGEIKHAMRVCLIDTDGKVFACTSDGVRDSIARLSAQHGLPPWKPAVPLRAMLKELAGGKQRLYLMNADEPAAKGGAK